MTKEIIQEWHEETEKKNSSHHSEYSHSSKRLRGFWCLIESRGNNNDQVKTEIIDVAGASELWSCLLRY